MFQQYTGGIAPVQGISEAGLNIGKFAQQGLQEFGKSLGEGIQEYHKNLALDQQASEEGHALAGQVSFLSQTIGQSPENAPLLPMLQEQITKLQKLPSMSLSQKLGAINGAKAMMSQFPQYFQMNQVANQQRVQNDIYKAEQAAKGKNITTMPAVASLADYDTSISPQANIDQNLIPAIQKAKAEGVQLQPDSEIIAQYLAGAGQMASTAKDLKGNPLDPKTVAALSDQLAKYKNFTENRTEQGIQRIGQNTLFDPNSEIPFSEDSGMETTGTYKAITSSLPEYMKPEPQPSAKTEPTGVSDTKSIEQILAEKKVSELSRTTATDAAVAKFANTALDNTRTTLDNLIRSGDNISVNDLIKSNAEFEIQNNPTSKVVNIPSGYGVVSTRLPSTYTNVRKMISDAAAKLKINTEAPMTADQLSSLRNELSANVEKTSVASDKAQKALEELKPSSIKVGVNAPEQNQSSLSKFNTGRITYGSYSKEEPLTPEQQKEQARAWFADKKQYGYVPSSFNSVWATLHPESTFKTITAPNGMEFYNDGKGEWKPVPQKTGMSPEEAKKYEGRIYNNQELISGSGMYANGIITGKEPEETKSNLTKAADAIIQIDRLLNITKNNFGKSLDFTTKAEAQKYVNFLKSAIRPELFPSGRVAEWEQIILDKLVPDPTGVWTLDDSTLRSLTVLREQIMTNIAANAANHGITISYNTNPDISRLASQARQDNRVAPPQ